MSEWKGTCGNCGKRINRRPGRTTEPLCLPCRKVLHPARIPCEGCGTVRGRREVTTGVACRTCSRLAAEVRRAELEAARIDWAAIDAVVQGYEARLTGTEKRLVVRQLERRLISSNEGDDHNIPRWQISSRALAEQMHCTRDAISQIVRRLPPGEKRACPDCRGSMWVVDGVVEEHGNGFHERCEMSDAVVALRGLAQVRPDLYMCAVS